MEIPWALTSTSSSLRADVFLLNNISESILINNLRSKLPHTTYQAFMDGEHWNTVEGGDGVKYFFQVNRV